MLTPKLVVASAFITRNKAVAAAASIASQAGCCIRLGLGPLHAAVMPGAITAIAIAVIPDLRKGSPQKVASVVAEPGLPLVLSAP